MRLGGVIAVQHAHRPAVERGRPVQDILAKIVDAAQSDVATQLGSLEETVLTLAEALLRPGGRPELRPEGRIQERVELRPVPAPRDGAEV